MITREQFIEYLKEPVKLNEDTVAGLKEIISDFPYFQIARMLYLRNLKNINSYRFESELYRNAVFISNRKMLYKLLNDKQEDESAFQLLPFDKEAFENFFKEDADPGKEELIGKDTAVYRLLDDVEPVASKKKHFDLVDEFIERNPGPLKDKHAEKHENTENENAVDRLEDSLITETLADVYVRQGLYSEALSAYEKLSLKFPEKNSYFVAQIEKIKKLISKDL